MFLLIILLILGIAHESGSSGNSSSSSVAPPAQAAQQKAEHRSIGVSAKSNEAVRMEAQGLVNVKSYAPDIVVQLAYASSNNILRTQLYDSFSEAYLQKNAAVKLALAQRIIKNHNPSFSIVVHDAARPQRVQLRCWEIARARRLQYLFTPPGNISMHTYGVAVDVSLISLSTGAEVDMGSSPDEPGALAAPKRERSLLQSGKLTAQQYANRLLLRKAMQEAGFSPIGNEWWHFEACSRREAREKYRPIL
ncbi:MAG: D-alanyl-D-alanine dipeptidase [Prevotellaceae bacterium]|nr:D-alanyl-D-alanine dipeptidase [Prevotellaceae bacterium]